MGGRQKDRESEGCIQMDRARNTERGGGGGRQKDRESEGCIQMVRDRNRETEGGGGGGWEGVGGGELTFFMHPITSSSPTDPHHRGTD